MLAIGNKNKNYAFKPCLEMVGVYIRINHFLHKVATRCPHIWVNKIIFLMTRRCKTKPKRQNL